MTMLVSLEQAREHLRRDTTDGDADLLLKVKGASRAVMNYIRSSALTQEFTDSAGDVFEDSNGVALFIPEDIQIATLFLVGSFDTDRTGEAGVINPQWSDLFLPRAVRALLTPYHEPPLA